MGVLIIKNKYILSFVLLIITISIFYYISINFNDLYYILFNQYIKNNIIYLIIPLIYSLFMILLIVISYKCISIKTLYIFLIYYILILILGILFQLNTIYFNNSYINRLLPLMLYLNYPYMFMIKYFIIFVIFLIIFILWILTVIIKDCYNK